ncbi:MAG: polyprenyl synthetase family protein [Halobacteria archaeon]|nr:polyprenyl synthetase family protein [Halobacteria archaeon]
MSERVEEVKDEVAKRGELVDDAIEDVLPLGSTKALYEASRYLLEAGGKRLRPSILLLVTEAFGRDEGDYEGVMPAALAIEIVHSFTLIHDDIMDDDSLRRGVPSVHVKWDESTAILAGDTLYSKAFEIMLQSDAPPEEMIWIIRTLAETCTRICEGQAMDVDFEDMEEVSEEEYMEMIEKKTAVLFAASAGIGAILGGGNRNEVENLYEYGLKVGKAFQIQDDVLDLTATSDRLGKTRASDLVENKQTLINIHARRNGVDTTLPANATDDEIEAKVKEIEEVGSIEYARGVAADLVNEGKRNLEVLPDSRAKRVLEDIADYLVERDH